MELQGKNQSSLQNSTKWSGFLQQVWLQNNLPLDPEGHTYEGETALLPSSQLCGQTGDPQVGC